MSAVVGKNLQKKSVDKKKTFIKLLNNQSAKSLKEQLYLGLLQSVDVGDFRKTPPYEELLTSIDVVYLPYKSMWTLLL